ncbi:amyloid-beta A4 precursor -binding family B member 1 isoform X1 [Pelobates cultripes]|uniref:Amyloid-beta A4 -binding family B member 1 isoform X1 n=1 Tax=Pelobates cultripes TaxID=61616 RepID=A0AAD1VSE7_PELCU|nr:amyloid-beta A4 precursor -binding family B member 1 isoform X1 [Pelobates cultripes]
MSGTMTENNPVSALTLSLISSHNDLLSPKSRQIYAHTDLQSAMGLVSAELGNGTPSDRTNPKWLKEGQNQLRKAAENGKEDQNCNPDPESSNKDWTNQNQEKEGKQTELGDLEVSALNSVNLSSMLSSPLLIQVQDREDEEDEDLTPAPSEITDPITTETSELSSDILVLGTQESGKDTNEGPRDGGRSASLLFGMRNTAGSDEDSSWATLSQGSPSYGSPDDTDCFWTRNSLETDSDLPSGWMRVQDTSGTYYWHVPTGTTQWEPPLELCNGENNPYPRCMDHTPSEDAEVLLQEDLSVGQNELEDASYHFNAFCMRSTPTSEEDQESLPVTEPGSQSFPVQSLGWVEMTEEDLAPGRSSVAVNSCIRQLSLHNQSLTELLDTSVRATPPPPTTTTTTILVDTIVITTPPTTTTTPIIEDTIVITTPPTTTTSPIIEDTIVITTPPTTTTTPIIEGLNSKTCKVQENRQSYNIHAVLSFYF